MDRAVPVVVFLNRPRKAPQSNPDKRAKYTAFIDIYADLDNNERMLFEQQYRQEDAVMAGSMYRFAEQHENIGLQKGLEQGQRALLATARNMILKTRMDDATIADLTGLPEAEVKALRESEATPLL